MADPILSWFCLQRQQLGQLLYQLRLVKRLPNYQTLRNDRNVVEVIQSYIPQMWYDLHCFISRVFFCSLPPIWVQLIFWTYWNFRWWWFRIYCCLSWQLYMAFWSSKPRGTIWIFWVIVFYWFWCKSQNPLIINISMRPEQYVCMYVCLGWHKIFE